jgi:hypothetical protein
MDILNEKLKKIGFKKNYHKEYYEKNKTQLDYYYKNKEKILKKRKNIRDNYDFEKRQLIKQYQREYYRQQKQIKIFCSKCQTYVVRRNMYIHVKTKKHSLTPEEIKSKLLDEIKNNVKPFNNKINKREIDIDEKIYNRYNYQRNKNKQKHRNKIKKIERQQQIIKERHSKPFSNVIVIWV